MESRVIFLFMIILVASLSPSSCARPTGFPTSNTLRDDDDEFVGYYGDQVARKTTDSFKEEYNDDVAATANKYYHAKPDLQRFDDLQAFPKEEEEEWRSTPTTSTFNVKKYGAVGNGKADDTQAFLKAWRDVCASTQGIPPLIVPKGYTFLLNSLEFQGPCRAASVNFQLNGNLVAPNNMNAWKDKEKWVQFSNVQGLIVNGGGRIDGRGQVWWRDCSTTGCTRPTALHFHQCNGLRLSDLTHIDSARNHISISSCDNVLVSGISIRAPADSPNTDGIDISASTNINIQDSFIGTGDDCIAINSGTSHVNITGVLCGPGHGISIGSLGEHGSYSMVEDVQVRKCIFKDTTYGARIKTWKGGSGYARHIVYENIIIQGIKNPIIIDQEYFDHGVGTLGDQGSAVQVSDVTFRNFQGSVAGDVAITLDCDDRVSCKNIVMDHIIFTPSEPGKKVTTYCKNVRELYTSLSPILKCS